MKCSKSDSSLKNLFKKILPVKRTCEKHQRFEKCGFRSGDRVFIVWGMTRNYFFRNDAEFMHEE
jgi:hypothetical protein